MQGTEAQGIIKAIKNNMKLPWKKQEDFKGVTAAHTLNADKTIIYIPKVEDSGREVVDKWIYLSELINKVEEYDSIKKSKK